VYSRKLDDKVLEFGVSGRLWKNALVMYDRQTETWWSHITGKSIHGPLKGKVLERETNLRILPRISFGEWRSQFPETQVLSVGGREQVETSSYANYHLRPEVGIGTSAPVKDNRLPHKSIVLGIDSPDGARAYPVKLFEDSSLYVDSKPEDELLVFYEKKTGGGAVYSTTVNGKKLKFGSEAKGLLVKDREGNSWNLLLGVAVDGPLKGQSLKNYPVMEIFWGAWIDYYPKTFLVGE